MTSRATRRAPLGAIAHARSGDKGAHANIGVWVRHDDAFAFMCDALTADLVADHFALVDPRHVDRYELPNLRALNFVLRGVLGAGGGAASLRTDAQAKAYGQALLRVELSIPLTLLASATRPPFETRHVGGAPKGVPTQQHSPMTGLVRGSTEPVTRTAITYPHGPS